MKLLSPVPPFENRDVASIGGKENPLMAFAFSSDSEDYGCYNCRDILVRGSHPGQISPSIVFECARCSALNVFEGGGYDDEQSIPPPRIQVRLYRHSAPFRLPLSPGESILISNFMLMWGQIDEMLVVSMAVLLKIPLSAAAQLTEGMTAGPRLARWLAVLKESASEDVIARGKGWHKKATKAVAYRNQIAHGVWGVTEKDGQLVAACRHSGSPKLLYASQLIEVTSVIADLSYEISCILYTLLGRPTPPKPGHPDTNPQLILGPNPTDLPEFWLRLTS